VSTEQLVAARALRTTIDANAREAGSDFVPKETVEALTRANLWGVMTPRALGGSELSLVDAIDVFAETARANGSAGWCHMAGASTVAYFAAYCSDDFVRDLFGQGIPLAAGQFAPNGVGVREEDGFRVSGSYSFGSGIHYADWVGMGFLVMPPEGSDEPAEYRFGLLPKSEVELAGNWNVLGLESTASLDYTIDGALVPEEATFLFANPTRHRGSKALDLGVIANTAAGHAGFAIGVARRALDELMAIAKTKARMGAASFLKDGEAFQLTLGRCESRLRSSAAWVREAFDEMERGINETGEVDVAAINRARQATVFVTEEAADIVRQAYLLAGTTALRDGPLQTCFRDIHAGSQHFFASPASTRDFAANLMDAAAHSGVDAD